MKRSEELAQMQALPLNVKILLTYDRIREWYRKFNGDVYISFSGGKDSTVLLDLVRTLYPDVPAVYVDTGLEYTEIRDFVKTIDNVTWLRPVMGFKDVILKYGYPLVSKEQSGYIHEYRTTKSDKLKNIRWNGNDSGGGKISEKWKFLVYAPFEIGNHCCYIMKKQPAILYEKKTGQKPFIGTTTEESELRKESWIQYGCNAFDKKRQTSRPLSFWTEQDILQYLKERNLSYATCYGEIVGESGSLKTTGCRRTGCEFCLYGIHKDGYPNRLQRIEKMHPKRHAFILKPIEEGGLGYQTVLDWHNKHNKKVYIPYKYEGHQITFDEYLSRI